MKPVKNIGAQVEEYLKEHKDLTPAKLAEKVNSFRVVGKVEAKRQTITQLIEAGDRIPKFLGPLAAAMGTTVDDMLVVAGLAPASMAKRGKVEQEAAPSLSDEEQMILDIYGKLDPAVRAAILVAASALVPDAEEANFRKVQATIDALRKQKAPRGTKEK